MLPRPVARLLGPVLVLLLLASPLGAAEYAVGRSYFGATRYIEYVPGDLPIVVSAPHGGLLDPEEIPRRQSGVVETDANTQELARAVAAEMLTQTGHSPHLVVCLLRRRRLDCNREIVEAAAGDPTAEKAWGEYHAFIETALQAAVADSGKAFYLDLHGQAHQDQRIELGYLHSRDIFTRADARLDAPGLADVGSLRHLAPTSQVPYSALLRGPRSLGGMLESIGFPCTPSPGRPTPNLPYFQGGYSVRRHTTGTAPVAGLQIECNRIGVRDTAENRARFATALVTALRQYLAEHFGLRLPAR